MCISVHQLCYVHADKEPLFQNINLIVNTGQRLALVGNNGTGKSTFIKMLMGEVEPDSGRFDVGETVRFGYYLSLIHI